MLHRMPEPFARVYTDAQRDALAHAYEDRRIRPAARVAQLAEAGELEPGLPAFKVNRGAQTVREYAAQLRQRRAAEHTSKLAKAPPRDSLEALRRRLISAADGMMTALERQPAAERDPERLRQIARAVREAAAMPAPQEPAPAAPGAKVNGRQVDGTTRGGIAGPLMQAHREGTAPQSPNDNGDSRNATSDNGEHQRSDTATENDNAAENDGAGSWARSQAMALGLGLEGPADGG